jgi:uncharacterized protein (TIGR00661 family)
MNIVYAIAGEGMGHATRSRPIIAHLAKKHNVRVFAGGKALPYLRRFFNVSWIGSTHIVYRNNAVMEGRTVLLNIVRLPLYVVSFLKMLFIMLFQRPDILVTDYEPWSCWTALLTGVPVVSIDNENVITRAKLSLPRHHRVDFIKAWLVTMFFIPSARATIIPSFFFPPLKDPRAKYVNPVIRPEIAGRKPTDKGYVLVYQTSQTNLRLLDTLKRFPKQQFIVYGFPREGQDANLLFKRFSEHGFFSDLASAKAVIANGGFSLLSEAVYLRKPVLSVPVIRQCEQIINAHYLEKLGYGVMAHEATAGVIRKFLAGLHRQRQALKKRPLWHLQSLFTTIEKVLHNVTE